MQESASTRFSVSYHTKDLLKRDPLKVQEVANWLETHAETNRDRAQRRGSRRMMARLIAAKQLLRALDETAAAREVMDRTEGKVADVHIQVDGNQLIEALEAGRERLLQARNANISTVDGEVVSRQLMSPEISPVDSDTSK